MGKYRKGIQKATDSRIQHEIFPNMLQKMFWKTATDCVENNKLQNTVAGRLRVFHDLLAFLNDLQDKDIIEGHKIERSDDYGVVEATISMNFGKGITFIPVSITLDQVNVSA